jgi:hypothetical protein
MGLLFVRAHPLADSLAACFGEQSLGVAGPYSTYSPFAARAMLLFVEVSLFDYFS